MCVDSYVCLMYITMRLKKRQLRADRLSSNNLSADMQDNMIERNLLEDYDIPPSC